MSSSGAFYPLYPQFIKIVSFSLTSPTKVKYFVRWKMKLQINGINCAFCEDHPLHHCTVGEIRVFCPIGVLGVFI